MSDDYIQMLVKSLEESSTISMEMNKVLVEGLIKNMTSELDTLKDALAQIRETYKQCLVQIVEQHLEEKQKLEEEIKAKYGLEEIPKAE